MKELKELNLEQMAQIEGGCWGNVVAGAMIGGVFGPGGAAVGALSMAAACYML